MARILFTANPMRGHVNTLVPLATAARRAGHEVAVATGPDMTAAVERHGLTAWPVGPTHADAGGRVGLSADYFVYAAEKRALDLVPRAVDWRPDLVVNEDTELAGPVAAAATGARTVVHGLGLMVPARIWAAFAPTVDRLGARWGVRDLAATVRDATYLEVCPPALREEGDRVWRETRPIRPLAGPPAPGEMLPDLPAGPFVHLTLGTVFHESAGVLEAAIEGLRELPVALVVTVGPGVDPDRFGPQPAHVRIERYLPHALLLPRCDLVVSQGGAGIMFGALTHGTPQLVLPQGGDQFMNADACHRAGAALVLGPGDVTAAAVHAAAGRLLAEPEFGTAARAVQAEIAAMPDADAVLAGLTTDSRCASGCR